MGAVYGELKNLTQEELAAGDAVDILAKKFDGAAEAMSKTAAGLKKNIADAIDDAKENIGELIAALEMPQLEMLNQKIFDTTRIGAFSKAFELVRKEGVDGITVQAQALEAFKGLHAAALEAVDKLNKGEELTQWQSMSLGLWKENKTEILGFMKELEAVTAESARLAAVEEKAAKQAEARAKAQKDAAEAAAAAKIADEALFNLLAETWLEIRANILESQETIEPLVEAAEDFGGAIGVANDHMAQLNAQAEKLSKTMGGGMVGAPIMEGIKTLGKGGMNAQFDWKGPGADEFDKYATDSLDKFREAREEAWMMLQIESETADIMRDKTASMEAFLRFSGRAEKIETVAAQAARESAEYARDMAQWTEEWSGQLENLAKGALQETITMLDKANAVGWEEAAGGFDAYMVRLVDQLPMLLLTEGLQVIGVNPAVGIALIIASGLVAIIDAATTSAAEVEAYASSTAGKGGGGSGSTTINYNIAGSIWQDRALEAAAVDANRRASRSW
jgi:hypothetical protein